MKIKKEQSENKLTVTLEGRLDADAALLLESELQDSFSGISELVIDLSRLEYISATGLRALVFVQNKMKPHGKTVVRNASENVREILDVTGVIRHE